MKADARRRRPTLAEVVLGRSRETPPRTPVAASTRVTARHHRPFRRHRRPGRPHATCLALCRPVRRRHMPEIRQRRASRTDLTDENFRQRMRDAFAEFAGAVAAVFDKLAPRLTYQRVHYDEPASFTGSRPTSTTSPRPRNLGGNRIFYWPCRPTPYEASPSTWPWCLHADESNGHARWSSKSPSPGPGHGEDPEQAQHTRFAEHRSSATTTTWPRRRCKTS